MGDEPPDFIKNAPTLIEGLDWHYNLFWEIYRYRPVKAKNDFVEWETLNQLAKRYEIDSIKDFEEFIYYFREMEKVYLNHISANDSSGGDENGEGFIETSRRRQGSRTNFGG